jgi:hypothetical protein
MANRRRPYSEGDLFAVPLNDGSYGVGLAARVSTSPLVLGYFFQGRYQAPPTAEDVIRPDGGDVMLVVRFSNIGLMRRSWPVIGHLRGWNRLDWPMPLFGRTESGHEIVPDRYLRVRYGDDPAILLGEAEISKDEYESLPRDGAAGFIALQDRLSRLLLRQ